MAVAEPTLPATFDRPSPMRRAVPLLLIILLHLGFVAMLQNGLLQRAGSVEPLAVVTAMLFPPEPVASTPVPASEAVLKPKPASKPMVKPISKPTIRPVTPPPPVVARPAVAPAQVSAVPTASVAPLVAPAPLMPATPAPEGAASLTAAPVVASVGPKTVSSGVQYLQAPRPDYPAQSKRLGEEGKVVLRVLVSQQGVAERIEVQKSSGFARLDDAAREAVQRARFKPHLEDGTPVAVFAVVPITFRLDQ